MKKMLVPVCLAVAQMMVVQVASAQSSGEADPGLLAFDAVDRKVRSTFVEALSRYRHFERETDPPLV